MTATRRHILGQVFGIGVIVGVGFAAARLNAQTVAPACYDPSTLPFTQKSRRRALGYVEASTNPARRCGLCAFFTSASPSCGTCQMLSGGPVNVGGLCNSFAPKATK